MSVYVDKYEYPYGRMKMSHMIADTLVELHAMADSLGLRRWFQNHSSFPHYDVWNTHASRSCWLAIGKGKLSHERPPSRKP